MKHPKQSNQGSAIDAALAKIGASPLVGLAEEIPYIHTDNSCPMSKDDWGYVTSTGHIFLNPRKDGTIGEWTHVLAHLMLHLGLGHLREDRIHDPVWQQTCDIAVTRFLLDGRIGTPPMDVSGILNAAAYDQGIMAPDEIAGTVKVRGRGGTKLQPGIDLLDEDTAFPREAPLLIITDGACDRLNLRRRTHAFLIPAGNRLPFTPHGPVFRLK